MVHFHLPVLFRHYLPLALAFLLAGFVGGVGNRVRGGVWPLGGDIPARMFGWGLPCGLVAMAAGFDLLASWEVAMAAFVGCSTPLFNSLDIGLDGRLGRDWWGLTLFSLGRVAPVMAVLWFFAGWRAAVIAAGIVPLGALLYWLSLVQPFRWEWMQIEPWTLFHPWQGPCFGEFAWGAVAMMLLLAGVLTT